MQAKDKATGKEQQIRIQASGGLSEADIKAMVKEAEANADADKKRREQVEARNQTEAMVHQVEKTLKDGGDKVAPESKTEAEAAIAGARTALEGQDADALKAANDRLTQVAMKIGEAMYKADAAAAEPPTAANEKGEKVVDAEFEEVDEKKKKAS